MRGTFYFFGFGGFAGFLRLGDFEQSTAPLVEYMHVLISFSDFAI